MCCGFFSIYGLNSVTPFQREIPCDCYTRTVVVNAAVRPGAKGCEPRAPGRVPRMSLGCRSVTCTERFSRCVYDAQISKRFKSLKTPISSGTPVRIWAVFQQHSVYRSPSLMKARHGVKSSRAAVSGIALPVTLERNCHAEISHSISDESGKGKQWK